MLGASLVLGMMMRRHCARVSMGAVRALGAMVMMACLLNACSTPEKDGVAEKKMGEALERYYDVVFRLTNKEWNLYRGLSPNNQARGSLRVSITLSTNGELKQIHVKNNKDTDPLLTNFTVKAIHAIDYPPMPAKIIPWVKEHHDGQLVFPITFIMNEQANGGAATDRSGTVAGAESRQLMEKRWGLPPESLERPGRQVAGEVPVKLPSSTPTKGLATTVKLTSSPLDRYYKLVTGQVEKKWNIYLHLRPGALTEGYLELVFYVNKRGKVEDLRIVNAKDSNPLLTEITLRAVKDADIPRMPVEVMPLLPKNDPERLKIEYNVLIY